MEFISTGHANQDDLYRDAVDKYGASLQRLASAYEADPEKRRDPNAMPFMTLVVVWIAAYFVIRVRKQRKLQREIDELNDIEMRNSR